MSVRLTPKLLCTCMAMLCLAVNSAFGSTLLLKLEKHRILIAADTRKGAFNSTPTDHSDTTCKIQVFGQSIFAVSGLVIRGHTQNGQSTLDWDAFEDAKSAYATSHGNTKLFAQRWGALAASHVARLDREALAHTRSDLGLSSEIIEGAFFVSWNFGSPILLIEYISSDRGTVTALESTLSLVPYVQSTNLVTQELVKKETARAKTIDQIWKVRSAHYSNNEASWRYLEFLIKQTSRFDDTVSPTADILEVDDTGKVSWLKKTTCH